MRTICVQDGLFTKKSGDTGVEYQHAARDEKTMRLKSDREIAEAGLEALRNWMQEIGLPLTISEIGATPDMIDNIVSTTVLFPAGYLDLTAEDIREILKESL